jgi:hypothetical protein
MLLRALEVARVTRRTHALLSHTLPPVGNRKRLRASANRDQFRIKVGHEMFHHPGSC